MARPPTFRDSRDAIYDKERRRGRDERAVSLHLAGWSTGTCLAIKDRREDRVDVSMIEAWHLQKDLYELGITPPTSNPKSKRKIHDAPGPGPQDDLAHYSG